VGSELYRVLYRRSAGLIMLLHVFRKKTGKVPPAEIEIAQERWDDFKARMDAVPPTAATGRPRRALSVLAPLLT